MFDVPSAERESRARERDNERGAIEQAFCGLLLPRMMRASRLDQGISGGLFNGTLLPLHPYLDDAKLNSSRARRAMVPGWMKLTCYPSGMRCVQLADLRKLRGRNPDKLGRRPANASLRAVIQKPLVPRTIVQTGKTFAHALVQHARYMATWWSLNPEYTYRFYSDLDADAFVAKRATASEQSAWNALTVGAQRADLFRMLYLKYCGGVYADLDAELGRPLREIMNYRSSAVTGLYWPFECLIYAPGHPIIVEAARLAVEKVMDQARLEKTQNPRRCRNAQQCILATTGPINYLNALYRAAKLAGCTNKLQRLGPRACLHSKSAAMRDVHICGEPGYGSTDGIPAWDCVAFRHWDCRYTKISGMRSGSYHCHSMHYSKPRLSFFKSAAEVGSVR